MAHISSCKFYVILSHFMGVLILRGEGQIKLQHPLLFNTVFEIKKVYLKYLPSLCNILRSLKGDKSFCCVMTHQKSFGVPNHVKGQMIRVTITIHKHCDNAWWVKSVIKSAIKIMKTQAAPYNVARIQPAKKVLISWKEVDMIHTIQYSYITYYFILSKYSSSYLLSICNYVP